MRTTLTIFAATVAVLLFAKLFWNDCRFLAKASADLRLDSAATTKTTPAEYLQLFKSTDKLVPDGSDVCKRRNAVSKFYYDKKYFLEVYKMDGVGNLPLGKLIREKFTDAQMSPGMNYLEYAGDTQFAVEYLSRPRQRVSNILLTLYGDSTRTIKKNDTLAYYYSKFESFSLSNSSNKAKDIYGHLREEYSGSKTPLELLFLKRGNNVYFILLGASNGDTPVGRDLLYNLVAENNLIAAR